MAGGWAGGWGGAELWGGCLLGEAEPAAHTPPLAREPQPLLQAGPRLSQVFLRWLVVQAVGQVGWGWPREEEALAPGAPGGAVIVGRAISRWAAEGRVLHFHCNGYIKTWSVK